MNQRDKLASALYHVHMDFCDGCGMSEGEEGFNAQADALLARGVRVINNHGGDHDCCLWECVDEETNTCFGCGVVQ